MMRVIMGRIRNLSLTASVAAFLPAALTAQAVSTVELDRPTPIDGIWALPDGSLLAATGFSGDAVVRIDASGRVTNVATGLSGPIHVVVDETGNLYVSNYSDHGSVSRVTVGGDVTHFANVPQGPAGMALGPNGDLFVAIYGDPSGSGRSIYRIGQDGVAEVFVEGSGIESPIGLAFDDDGDLLVVNAKSGRILRISPEGSVSPFAELPIGPGFFSSGHLAYNSGTLYASGNSSHVVYSIDPNGSVCTLVGSGSPGAADGVGEGAELRIPNGIAVSTDGSTLYVVAGGGGENVHVRIVRLDAGRSRCR